MKKFIAIALFLGVICPLFVHGAIPTLERSALIALYNSTTGASWTDNSGWKTPPLDTDGFAMPGTEGTWYGITVTADHVTSMNFSSNNLSGAIPAEIGNLTSLQYIDLGSNQLSGSIPTEIGNLTLLTDLGLYYNQLTGALPTQIGNLAALKNLYLNNNLLTGAIPTQIGNLTALQSLLLGSNQLSGAIPTQIGNLTSLTDLELYSNQFTGAIPTQIGNLTALQNLYINDNQLTGAIPTEIGNLTSLQYLFLDNNQLTGAIPTGIGNLTSLTFLGLTSNQLSGVMPTQIGNLASLQYFYLNSNQLSGAIPTELGNLTTLLSLNLSSNKLIGAIPTTMANLIQLTELDINYNGLYTNDAGLFTFLNGIQPDWAATQTIAPVDVHAVATSTTSITLSWTPISYTGDTGGYRAYVSTILGGPYTFFNQTASKTDNSILVTGLTPNTPFYFVVTTRTDTHTNQQNVIDSEYSLEVHATTFAPNGITLTSPNGGEIWPLGSSRTITWTSIGVSTNIKLVLFQNGVKKGNIVTNIPIASGFYHWTVGNYIGGTATAGAGYTVRIIDMNGQYSDYSNASFTITPLNLVSPNGYENWQLGSTHPITWTAPGIGGFVKLVLFKDGIKVGNIVQNLSASSGAYSWTVGGYQGGTAVVGTGYTVRVITMDGLSQDNSDAAFSITAASPMNLTLPNGGERWQIGTSQSITWTAGGVTHNVKLVLFKNGVKIGNIVVDIPVGTGSYSWNAGSYIGGTATADIGYTVRIITMDGVYKDESDGPFELLTTVSPVGGIDTPSEGTTGITGVLPISGWALDDEEVTRVEIWRSPVGGEREEVYLGEAVMLENARPEIERQYPDYPDRSRAGWGYTIATATLPDQGSGVFQLRAVAYDREGNKSVLGEREIACNNAAARNPFGEILAPSQGETISANNYTTTGWALTSLPKSIPADGSTLGVYVDGMKVGQPIFGQYHAGAARMFPNLANSRGAEGSYSLDTSTYADGMHVLGWAAGDNFGMTAGTGQNYFKIENGSRRMPSSPLTDSYTWDALMGLPAFQQPLRVKRGYAAENLGELVYPSGEGTVPVEMEELDRVVIELTPGASETTNAQYTGYLVVGNDLRPLPVGSTLDHEKGIYYWQSGAGFIGQYDLVFTDGTALIKIMVNIKQKQFNP
jgi:Leucine-rich repeat (LRR) protein